jgi:hypothetical protein
MKPHIPGGDRQGAVVACGSADSSEAMLATAHYQAPSPRSAGEITQALTSDELGAASTS